MTKAKKGESERLARYLQNIADTLKEHGYVGIASINSSNLSEAASLLRQPLKASAPAKMSKKKPTIRFVSSCADGVIRWADEVPKRLPTKAQRRDDGDMTTPGFMDRMAFAEIINEYFTAHPEQAPKATLSSKRSQRRGK